MDALSLRERGRRAKGADHATASVEKCSPGALDARSRVPDRARPRSAGRVSDGIQVRMLWNERDGRVTVTVVDDTIGTSVQRPIVAQATDRLAAQVWFPRSARIRWWASVVSRTRPAVGCRWPARSPVVASTVHSSPLTESHVFKRIVVGVDGREGGRDALALAAAVQGASGGEMIAVHVYTYDRTVALADAPAGENALQKDLLTTLASELQGAGVSARAVIARDLAPAQALHAAAEREEADLIVVGSCHRAGADRVLAGDDAAATLHGAPCAVAVAPHGYAERPHELRLIGVGYDGSPESRRALDLACGLADRTDARVRATTVVWPSSPFWPTTSRYPGWPATQVSGRQRGEEMLEAAIARVRDRVTPEVAVGKGWQVLASSSADLDLLIVGSRACGPVRRVVLGSTSTHLVREAACPVVVLPRGAAAFGDAPGTATHAV